MTGELPHEEPGDHAYVAYLTAVGYAPRRVDHIHDTLSAVLRTAVKWGHLQDIRAAGGPARASSGGQT
jgi:hypothetical protein